MRACGIDLGTTNSCIYVVEEGEGRLIADDQGHATVPSVVYAGRDGAPVVGLAARNRMGELPGPVTAVKRKMGSTETVLLGGVERTPVEVSALLLAALKEMAERRTGAPVDRAVVTVPAYFSHVQRQQTDEAGRRAGFREVATLLEPVAAALAYSLASDREALKVFVYDLGGGTFDATVLEKDRHGGISVLAFGGDPFLGGEDVDARLARRLARQLAEKGYRLELDLDRPEDASRFQRLKFWAELAKKELSESEQVALVRQGLFEDQAGDTVDLDLTLTRAELEAEALDLVERSIDASLATLAKAGLEPAAVDDVIMVGGMSRMPLVRRLLAAALGREPRLVDPDLIVARGAALKAAEVFGEQAVAATGLCLTLRFDRRTRAGRARIAGRFDRPLAGHTVYLLGGPDELDRPLAGTDRFAFEGVPLAPGDNRFTLSVEDAGGALVLEQEIRIEQDPEAGEGLRSPGAVVTKPIAVRTVDGLAVLFAENTALPAAASHTFETADQSGRIVVPIWEGSHEVTRLAIADLPRDLKVGTAVVVEVQILADYRIEAAARLPDLDRAVRADFRIEPVDTAALTPEAVRARLAALAEEARGAVERCPSAREVEIFALRQRALADEIAIELAEAEPKRARLHDKLAELAALVVALSAPAEERPLEPSFEEWSQLLTGILTRAVAAEHPKLTEARPQSEALREKAREAWERRDALAWRRVQEQTGAIARLLRPEMSPEERTLGFAAWLVTDQIPKLTAARPGRPDPRIDAARLQAEGIFLTVRAGVMDPQEGYSRLLALFQETLQPLQAELGLVPAAAPDIADPGALAGLVRQRPGAAEGRA